MTSITNYLKISFLTILLFLGLFWGLRAEAVTGVWLETSIVNPPVIAGQSATVRLRVSAITGGRLCVTVNFGDGAPEVSGSYGIPPLGIGRNIDFPHTYASEGSYTLFGQYCECTLGITTECSNFSMTVTVNPAPAPPPRPGAPDLNPLRYGLFGELIEGIFVVLFWAAIVLAPTLIVAGGLIMLFAGANPNNIVLGKKIILYTVVIFVIVLILRAMIAYFKGDLTFH